MSDTSGSIPEPERESQYELGPEFDLNVMTVIDRYPELAERFHQVLEPQLDAMIPMALWARTQAISHKNYFVGSSAYVGYDGGYEGLLVGWNVKPSPEPGRYCAEMMINDSASASNVKEVKAVVVIAEADEDHGSGRVDPTRHSCEECRAMMRGDMAKAEQEDREPRWRMDTLVLTIDPKTSAWELHTVAQMIEKHEGNGNGAH